jgi:solute carrier family 25 2-oxodicarboxylate transporter 21
VVVNPFEVVKVRLQSDRTAVKELVSFFLKHKLILSFQQRSTAAVAREIIKEHGFGTRGLYWGIEATLYRHGVWNLFYFGIYHNVKHLAPDENTSPIGNVSARLFLGFCAGTSASVLNIPFDVAKSRIQSRAPNDPKQRYFNTWQAINLVRREEGIGALYRGLVPKGLAFVERIGGLFESI